MFDNVAIMQETWYDKISIDRDQNPRFFRKGLHYELPATPIGIVVSNNQRRSEHCV